MNDLTEAKGGFSLGPRNMTEAIEFSKTLSKSDLVPKDFVDKPANILVAIQWGMELGLQPMQAMQSIAVINGRPSLWGDAVIGLVRSSGICEYVYEEVDETKATCRTKRKGDEKETVRTFTLEDAKKAGLAGKQGPWQQYPKRMLQMRARSWCLRDVYPDVLRGVHVAEEAQDIPPEKDVTPAGAEMVEQPRSRSAVVQDAEVVTPATHRAEGGGPISHPTEAFTKVEPKPEVAASEGKPANDGAGGPAKPLAEGQLRIVRAKLKQHALTEADLIAHFGALEQLRFEQFDDIQGWIAERSAKVAG